MLSDTVKCKLRSSGSSTKSFQSCHPMINIDGTNLYRKYKRKILVAVGVGVNKQLITLAFVLLKTRTMVVGLGSWLGFGQG